jgi:hypothetical protein
VVAAGVVGAGAGVALAAGGAIDLLPDSRAAASREGAPYRLCPGEAVAGYRQAGDRVLVTARNADGKWVEIRSSADLGARVWMAADDIVPDGPLDDLPERECASSLEPRLVAATPLADVLEEKDEPKADPTPSADPGEDSATDEQADSTGPSITEMSASPKHIYEHFPNAGNCDDQNVSTIKARVTGSSGVASVRLRWSVAGESGSKEMTRTGTIYSGTVGPFEPGTVPSSGANVRIRILAVDDEGNQRTARTTVRLHSADECVF